MRAKNNVPSTAIDPLRSQRIWEEGYSAYCAGNPEESNEYKEGTTEAEIWLDGFDDAREDEREKSDK